MYLFRLRFSRFLFLFFRKTGIRCAAHSIDLLLEDIVAMKWASATVASVKKATKFIKRHQKTLAIFSKHSPSRGLLLPNDTRFGASVITVERFVARKPALRGFSADADFNAYLKDEPVRRATREVGRDVKAFILDEHEVKGEAWFDFSL